MQKKLLFILLISSVTWAQVANQAFEKGEWLRYRISYSNFFNAGNATLQIKETTYNGKEVYNVIGKGKTTGVISWFFKVKDHYESFFDKDKLLPYRFIRDINEGGYTKNKEILFDHTSHKALVKDFEKNTQNNYDFEQGVQDMISTLYYLRSMDISGLKKGDEISLKMFFDEKNYTFKLKFLGRETINTKFGKVATAKFRPYVQSGRVFKEEESLTVWVSDDKNKIPLLIKASLAVGSLRADLDAYKGLANSFPIIFD